MEKYERVVTSLQDQMGHSFVELVKTKPDTFYREMTRPQAAFLRKCNVRVEDAVAAEQNAAAGATFENPDPASSSTNVDAEKERQSSVVDRFSNAGKQTDDVKSEDGEAEIQEEDDGEKNSYDPDQFSRKKVDEAELLKTEVFEPYQQIQVPNTFSGSKFVSPVKMDKDAEFEIELEKYKYVAYLISIFMKAHSLTTSSLFSETFSPRKKPPWKRLRPFNSVSILKTLIKSYWKPLWTQRCSKIIQNCHHT